jgi:biopolymer transport protein ExbD
MRRARRAISEPRLELTPLLDVMFLLLTFFIFAFVLMVRLEVTDIRLPVARAGQGVERAPSLTVSVRADGSLALENQPTTLDTVAQSIDAVRQNAPTTQLFIAVDERAPAGVVFLLMDQLRASGHTDLRFLRTPAATSEPAPPAGSVSTPP